MSKWEYDASGNGQWTPFSKADCDILEQRHRRFGMAGEPADIELSNNVIANLSIMMSHKKGSLEASDIRRISGVSSSGLSELGRNRLQAEWRDIIRWKTERAHDAPIILARDGFEAFPVSEGDLSVWRMRFLGGGHGLKDFINDDVCKFKGACFEAEVRFDANYPMEPPHFKFLEPVPYHPNVHHEDRHGDICISMLHRSGADGFNAGETKDVRWQLDYTFVHIGGAVLDLLGHPNMGGGTPASAVINGVLKKDPALFAQRTQECAKLSRDSAPKDVLERAAREHEEYGRLHEAFCKQVELANSNRRKREEEEREAAAAAACSASLQEPIGGFDDDDTPSSNGWVNTGEDDE